MAALPHNPLEHHRLAARCRRRPLKQGEALSVDFSFLPGPAAYAWPLFNHGLITPPQCKKGKEKKKQRKTRPGGEIEQFYQTRQNGRCNYYIQPIRHLHNPCPVLLPTRPQASAVLGRSLSVMVCPGLFWSGLACFLPLQIPNIPTPTPTPTPTPLPGPGPGPPLPVALFLFLFLFLLLLEPTLPLS